MILATTSIRDIDAVEHRVLGAIRLVDDPTGTTLVVPAVIESRSAVVIDIPPPGPLTEVKSMVVGPGALDIRQNRRGWFVIFQAPLFDTYTLAFLNPGNPLEPPANRRLRLRFAITSAGPEHLPRFFDFLLPRSLSADSASSVLIPHAVELLRAPAATLADGWAALRVRVRQNDTLATLPGVLIRAFRSPRAANAEPIGVGLTEWRDEHMRGEAVVPIPRLLRFTPGSGTNVLETTHAIELEVTRDRNFPDPTLRAPTVVQIPDVDALIAGVGASIVRRVSTPGTADFVINPPAPHAIAAAEELVLDLTMP